MRPRWYKSVTKCIRFFSPSLVYCALRYKNQNIALLHSQKATILYSTPTILFPVTDLRVDVKSRRTQSHNCKSYNTTANDVLREAMHRLYIYIYIYRRSLRFYGNVISFCDRKNSTSFPAPILVAVYASVSQPPGRGPVPGPGINYTGPPEVLLEFVVLVF